MNEEDLKAQIRDEILSGITFETFKSARLVTAICVTVIVDDGTRNTQAVCRFFLPNGVFLGEVPAQNILSAEKHSAPFSHLE